LTVDVGPKNLSFSFSINRTKISYRDHGSHSFRVVFTDDNPASNWTEYRVNFEINYKPLNTFLTFDLPLSQSKKDWRVEEVVLTCPAITTTNSTVVHNLCLDLQSSMQAFELKKSVNSSTIPVKTEAEADLISF